MELGRVGIWFVPGNRPVEQVALTAAEPEDLGFGAMWMSARFGAAIPKVFGACLAVTSRMVLATGILSVWHVSAGQAAAGAAAATLG